MRVFVELPYSDLHASESMTIDKLEKLLKSRLFHITTLSPIFATVANSL